MPSYPQWRVYPDYRGLLRKQELRGGVEVRRVRGYIPHRQSTLHRGLFEASFLLGALSALRMPRPDALLGVVPALSAGVAARIFGHRFRSPYGLIFQDLSGPGSLQSGLAGGGTANVAIRAAESWAARNATAVGIIAEGFRPYLESIGVGSHQIYRVRNWVQIEQARLHPAEVRRRLGLPQHALVCLHAGNMGFKQELSNVIECARLASRTDPRLLFVMVGDGSQRSSLLDLAGRYQLANVRFLPVQPPELFPSVLTAADILLVNQRPSVTSMSLPSKLTAYFASGRPVVAAVSPESETAVDIGRAGTAVLVKPDQPDALLRAIRQVLADENLQEGLRTAAQRYARTAMDADQALGELERLVHAIAAPRAPYSYTT
jgi:glycosyltransferase involved in cell wall biosynthesis